MTSMPNQYKLKAVQQHLLLQQMEIDVWVARDANTIDLVYQITQIKNQNESITTLQSDTKLNVGVKNSLNNKILFDKPVANRIGDDVNLKQKQDVISKEALTKVDKAEVLDKAAVENTIIEAVEKIKLTSFSLKGFSHNKWVVIVDMAFLTIDEQKVWDSLCRVLQVSVESFNFPNTYLLNESVSQSAANTSQTYSVEMANISFSGFMNRLSSFKQDINIACLTQITDGLLDNRIKSVPTLSQMLSDADKKRDFWQLINDNNALTE